MKIGIVGLPGCGKTTLFNLLTETFEAPDFGHAPGKPRIKSVKVRDPRLERLRDDYQPKKYTPAAVEIHDFPALSGGEEDRAGLADLLAPAREMDALILVVRGSPGGTALRQAKTASSPTGVNFCRRERGEEASVVRVLL